MRYLQTATAARGSRILSGLLVPYGAIGYTSAGPVRARAGSIRLPADLSRVKLVDEHRTPPQAIGYMVAARETPEGLRGEFLVSNTPEGDRALLENAEGARDAFSVELAELVLSDTGELSDSILTATALVTVPAWADARVDGLAASRPTSSTSTTLKGSRMTPEQRARLAELLAMNTRTPDDETEFLELVNLAATTEDPAPADAPADASASPELAAAIGRLNTLVAGLTPATLGGHMPGRQGGGAPGQRPIRDLFAAMARTLSGQSRPEMEAALADITSVANAWTSPSQYDGQLWDGLEYVRRFVPLMSDGPMTSYKGTGWRWTNKPRVQDYAGNKTAVPSNLPTTEATSWIAARLAGAHDIDRKFVDFGDTEFLAAYYAAMTESYAIQSDFKAGTFLVESAAQGVVNQGDPVPGGLFSAAAYAADAVEEATNGALPDYFLINRADRLQLINLTNADIPAYLETFGVTLDKFVVNPSVPPGQLVAGSKQATRFRELSGSPIRVETIDISKGGVDGGVFGYYATELVKAGGLVNTSFTA